MLSEGPRMGQLCASGKEPPPFPPRPPVTLAPNTHLCRAHPPPGPASSNPRARWKTVFTDYFFSDTSQIMFPFTLSPTLDHTEFNIWEDKLCPERRWQGWAVMEEFSPSKEDLPAPLWGPGPERPTVVCLSFHRAWCLLAAAMFTQNPTVL